MKLKIKEEALRDIEDLDEDRREWIIERIEELKQTPTSHPESALIRVNDRDVYRYKMKEDKRGGKDYRAIYDINSEEKRIEIKAIFHRDKGYLKDRLSDRV